MFSNEIKWVRIFDVQDIAKHRKGFTIYKVISMLYPETCPDAVTKITVWKRFNDFKKLHKDIKTLHKSLKIKDQVPGLPTATYFKRFDEDVIQHRKQLILTLLEYISLHSQLFTSNIFVKFFETSHSPTADSEVSIDDYSDEEGTASDTDSLSTVSSSMIQLTDDMTKLDVDVPITLKLSMGDLQLYTCELFGNSPTLTNDDEYITHADRFFELASEIETHKEFKVAWKHYMQGVFVLLKYGKNDKCVDRRQMARFRLEKYLLRIEKLFHLYLYQPIKTYVVDNYGEPFADVALSETNNVHFDRLFDMHNFVPLDATNDLFVKVEIGSLGLLNYTITQTAVRSSAYDADDFLNLAGKYETEQNYPAAYVNYKIAFMDVHVYKYLQRESKDLAYLLRNEKYVYRGDELLRDKQQVTLQENMSSRKTKHTDLYKYKVTGLNDANQMIVHDENGRTFIVRVIQKTFEFSTECLVLPKRVPYMDKLQRWHNTEDAIFLLFNFDTRTSTTPIKEYLLKLTNTNNTNAICDTVTKEVDVYTSSLSLPSDDFEFLDLPSSTNSFEDSDDHDFDSVEHEQHFIPVDKVRKWMAQMVRAIERLHKCGVVGCDLTIDDIRIDEDENVLIDYKCKLADDDVKVHSYKDALMLAAPELYTFDLVTPATDWWSLGVILYELLVGFPLNSINPDGFYTYPIIHLPKFVANDAKSLVKQLLIFEANVRLGAGGPEQVKSHPFFNVVQWQTL